MSNVSHLLQSFNSLVKALRASGEIAQDATLVSALDSLSGHVGDLANHYRRWWQLYNRTTSSVRCREEEDLRQLLTFRLEKVTRKAGEVMVMIERHAGAANQQALDSGEQFVREAKFRLEDTLWGSAKMVPGLIELICLAINERVALALAEQARAAKCWSSWLEVNLSFADDR